MDKESVVGRAAWALSCGPAGSFGLDPRFPDMEGIEDERRTRRVAISVSPAMDALLEQVRRDSSLTSKADAAYRLVLVGLGRMDSPEKESAPADEADLLEHYRGASAAHKRALADIARLFAQEDSVDARRA